MVMPFEELQRRYVSGVCATLIVEAIGQGTMPDEELANEVNMGKRQVVFQRLADALNRLPEPSALLSRGGGRREAEVESMFCWPPVLPNTTTQT